MLYNYFTENLIGLKGLITEEIEKTYIYGEIVFCIYFFIKII